MKAPLSSLLAGAAVANMTYFLEAGRAPSGMLHSLASAIASALLRTHRRRSVALVLTILYQGHRLDPVQVWAYNSLLWLRRMYEREFAVRTVVDAHFCDPRL